MFSPLLMSRQDARNPFEREKASKYIGSFNAVIVTSCGNYVSDVISIRGRALLRNALPFLETCNIPLKQNQANSPFTRTGFISDELYTITFNICRNGQKLRI